MNFPTAICGRGQTFEWPQGRIVTLRVPETGMNLIIRPVACQMDFYMTLESFGERFENPVLTHLSIFVIIVVAFKRCPGLRIYMPQSLAFGFIKFLKVEDARLIYNLHHPLALSIIANPFLQLPTFHSTDPKNQSHGFGRARNFSDSV